jgi:hypothetical protein
VNHLSGSEIFTPNSSALSMPLFDANGVLFAVLSLYAQKSAAFTGEHLRILEAVQPGFAAALRNGLTFEKKLAAALGIAAAEENIAGDEARALQGANTL